MDLRGERFINPARSLLGKSVKEFRGGKLQRVDGCENLTSIQGLVFTENALHEPYKHITWYTQKEARQLTKKEIRDTFSGRKVWIVCVANKKDIGREALMGLGFSGYAFYFDAERYTKEQMIALAKSVHLK